MFKREIKKKSIILPHNKYYHFGNSLPGFSQMCTLKKKKNPQAVVYVLFFYKFISLCIYLWLCWVFLAARGLSLVVVSGGYSLRCSAPASYGSGFSCCGARALGTRASVVMAHGLSSCGSRALEHRLSSCGIQA